MTAHSGWQAERRRLGISESEPRPESGLVVSSAATCFINSIFFCVVNLNSSPLNLSRVTDSGPDPALAASAT